MLSQVTLTTYTEERDDVVDDGAEINIVPSVLSCRPNDADRGYYGIDDAISGYATTSCIIDPHGAYVRKWIDRFGDLRDVAGEEEDLDVKQQCSNCTLSYLYIACYL